MKISNCMESIFSKRRLLMLLEVEERLTKKEYTFSKEEGRAEEYSSLLKQLDKAIIAEAINLISLK
jgi:hypothetical protein